MALLDLADRWRKETGAFVAVGHVDHGLRGRASRGDAAFVLREAGKRGLPGGILQAPARREARTRRRGLEEAARTLRYQALARLAARFRCPIVAAAHTLNDQVETFFLNLLRGAGPGGLGAMAALSPWPTGSSGPRLWRPLLGVPRNTLMDYLRARRVPSRRDATNALPLFLRNRLRPILARWEALRPGFFDRVAQTTRLLRDEEDFWRRRLGAAAPGSRRKGLAVRLERAPFFRYHIAEQRRRLRHLYSLTHFETLERVRLFAADRSPGPLDIPGGRVFKTGRFLTFRRRPGSP